MTFSRNCSVKGFLAAVAALTLLAGCAARGAPAVRTADERMAPQRIAVFPVENLSGTAAPLLEMRAALIAALAEQGFAVLDSEQQETVLARHRIRYTGGIDEESARAFREEAGVDAVLLTSLELYDAGTVPKIAFLSRLVATSEPPTILWMESIGMSGDESPGFLNLGVVREAPALLKKAMRAFGVSLAAFRSGEKVPEDGAAPRPQLLFRSPQVGRTLKECEVSFVQRVSRHSRDSRQATLSVALSSITDRSIAVRYDVVGGTARRGRDYRMTGGSLTFGPGEMVKSFTIDLLKNPNAISDRTVDVALSRPENALLGEYPVQSVVITHDETPSSAGAPARTEAAPDIAAPTVTFTQPSQTVREGTVTVTAMVKVSPVPAQDLSVPYTVTGTASAGTDYRVATPNPLRIHAGTEGAGIVIIATDNAVREPDKVLMITLGPSADALPGATPVHTITIKDDDERRSIAVLPFSNESERSGAGEIAMLHFLHRLVRTGSFTVIEPGVVRQKLLQMRMIMVGGISTAETDVLSRNLASNLVLTGRVADYQDPEGTWASPKVDLSASLIERDSERVVWKVMSRHTGSDAVLLFDIGRVYTANKLTSEMARVVEDILIR